MVFNNGIILQYGYKAGTGANGTHTLTFPISFTTINYGIAFASYHGSSQFTNTETAWHRYIADGQSYVSVTRSSIIIGKCYDKRYVVIGY